MELIRRPAAAADVEEASLGTSNGIASANNPDDPRRRLREREADSASATKGGDLGWLSAGDTVAEFDEAMKKLEINQVSPPVRTSFGWHLIQVLERRKQDVTIDRARSEAQTAIRQRKADEAFQDWVRQVRDKAFVEIRLDDR